MLAGERTEVRFAPRAPAGRHVRLEELAERYPAARAAPDGILEEGDRTDRVAGRAVDVPQVGGERDHGGEDPAALEHRDDGAGLACHADTAATSGHTAHSGRDVPVRAGANGPAAPGQNAAILVNITPVPSPVGSPKHACVPFTKDQVKLLTKGLLYINVHSSVALNGAIRGKVLPDKVKYKNVPAPTSPSDAFLE